jgi:GNAT superfamily N-acetyltransferase
MHSDSIQLLPATEADLPAIIELAGVVWRAHYPGIITTEQIEYMLARMYELATLEHEVRDLEIRYERLLARTSLVGFAAHGPTPEPGVRKLHKLYLHPDWHGQGLGSRLLRHCEAEALRLGARRLILTVNKRNTKAIAAYERNGFVIERPVVADIGGGFVMDDFLMAKPLKA